MREGPFQLFTSNSSLASMLSGAALWASLAAICIGGQSIKINQIPFNLHGSHATALNEAGDPIRTLAVAPPNIGTRIPQEERDTWNLECTSSMPNHKCGRSRDGSNTTFWQTKVDTEPHNITIDLRYLKNVNAISMTPLPDADVGGAIAGHKVYTSIDKVNWTTVAYGTWFEDEQGKFFASAS